jgi:hypothetical protein
MSAICCGRTTACIETPARACRIWPTRESTVLCDPCAARLRAMGMAIEDDRPEWRRRAEDGRLAAKDLTGALR